MCHTRWALSCFGIESRSKSPGRLYAVPAAPGSFPTLSLRIFPWMLDPVPRRYTVCSHLFLPRCHRPSPREEWVGCPRMPHELRLLMEGDFRGCRYSFMFRPPSLLAPRSFLPLRVLPQGSRGFYIRAYRALLPPHAPGMLTVRTQVIDGTGTYTLSDSQPCRLLTLLSRPFVCECPTISTVPRLQPPPRRTQRADFPHCAPPFASRQRLWDLFCWGNFRPVASHSIGVEQPESVIQPQPIPSFPAEALSFLSMRQMTPDLLLHPVFDEAEALAGMPHREVIHPPPEHRIDQVYHPFNRLRPVSAESLFERPHQRRLFLTL